MSNGYKWDIPHLKTHLQYAVDLELWTIPFYMSAMYSVKDPSSVAYRLIQSVVYQEMLHVELAGNVANSYGFSPLFPPPVYQGQNIPHLNFQLDTPDPTKIYQPYSAEIGPLDEKRINAMCLIEYPEWDTGHQPDLEEDINQYGSIGEFYDAVEVGSTQLADNIKGNINQVNFFQHYYNNFTQPTITKNGVQGLSQVMNLIKAIVDQGEGKTAGDVDVQNEYQNTADGFYEEWSHYKKFTFIRDLEQRPITYSGVPNPEPGTPGYEAQQILIKNFTAFREAMEKLFRGEDPGRFDSYMATLGGNILTCWQKGAIPKFS
ncbi:MAG: hypothetical protein F6K39_31920 [Okeania sp. SIO3B3]|nr:hypothetical protein [Okeania sp. SIO3B3]